MKPKISIILTVFNMESCIRESMDSLMQQTFSDYELICVDDGSTDKSLEILESYALNDSRISVISQENSGPAVARNVGLDSARGDYVLMLDSDDVFAPSLLEKLVDSIEDSDADVSVCRSYMFDNKSGKRENSPWTAKVEQLPPCPSFSCSDFPDTVLSAFVGWPWDKLYKRSFIEEHGLRFPRLRNSEDLYFVFLSLILARKIIVIDDELIGHRMNRSSSVSNSRLAEPLDFYRSTCLLKEEMLKLSNWNQLSWGFDNWALDYAIWNIETLPEGDLKNQLAERLISDGFDEIRLSEHSLSYYALVPNLEHRLKLLMGIPEKNQCEAHPKMSYIVEFFSNVQHFGWFGAFKVLADWACRKLSSREKKEDFEFCWSELIGRGISRYRHERETKNDC